MAESSNRLQRNQLYAWDQWLVWRLGGRPWLVSIVIAATLWAAMVFSLLGGYAVVIVSYNLIKQHEEIGIAAEMLGLSSADLLTSWKAHLLAGQSAARLVGIVGYLFGVVALFPALPGMMELIGLEGRYGLLPPVSMQLAAVWFFVVTPFAFLCIAKAFYMTVYEGAFWSRMHRTQLVVDIFDLQNLEPVSRAALRGALTCTIGATIGTLLFLSNDIERGPLLPFFIGIGLIAVLNLVVPLVGVHRKIVVEKEH